MTDLIQGWPVMPDTVWDTIRAAVRPYVGAQFVIDGDPVPKKRRIGQGRASFTPERTRKAEARVKQAFAAAVPGWVPEPDGTYGCLVEFRTTAGNLADVDNSLKLVLDALNEVFYADDIQVGRTLTNLVRGHKDPCTQVWLFTSAPNGTKTTKQCECGTRYRTNEKLCAACRRRRAIVNELLAGGGDAEAARRLDQDRRAVYSYIAACMIGRSTAPSPAAIAAHVTRTRGEVITEHRVRAVISTLTDDKYLSGSGRTLKIVKPLGVTV